MKSFFVWKDSIARFDTEFVQGNAIILEHIAQIEQLFLIAAIQAVWKNQNEDFKKRSVSLVNLYKT